MCFFCLKNVVKEIWEDIEDYEGSYQISNMGIVKSLKRKWVPKDHIVKQTLNSWGYLQINLSGRVTKTVSIHRLVALSFLLNPDNKGTVNHKNGIKTDNRLSNLEWNTLSENHLHAYKTGLKIGKSVLQYSLDEKLIAEYDFQKEAAIITGIDTCCISSACIGRSKTAGGFIWRFK